MTVALENVLDRSARRREMTAVLQLLQDIAAFDAQTTPA
jgi:hypothetical protein